MSSEVQQQIQQDWETREFIETVSEGIKKIAEFLNDFGKLEFSLDILIYTKASAVNSFVLKINFSRDVLSL